MEALQAAPGGAPPAILDELASTYELLEAFEEAEKASRLALEKRQSRGAPATEVLTNLAKIGLMQRAQGKPARAEATLRDCLVRSEQSASRETAAGAACQNMLGLAYRDLGRYSESETSLQAALATRVRLLGESHTDVGHTLNLLGTLYMLLGDHPRAEDYYLRAVEARTSALGPCHAAVGTALHYLADVYDATGRYPLALRVRQTSLALRERVLPPEDHSIAHGLMGAGETLMAMKRYGEAEPLLRRSLEIHLKVYGARHQRTLRSVWSLASLLNATGRADEAREMHEAGLRDASAEETPESLWRFQQAYAQIMRRSGIASAAVYFGKQAVNTIQQMRSAAVGLEQELQRTFVGTRVSVYRELADTLIEQGRLPEAQQVLAMLKEEEYFDFIRRDAHADVSATRSALTQAEQPWARRYGEISKDLVSRGARRDELERRRKLGLSAEEQAELARIEDDVAVARRAFVAFLDGLKKEMSRLDAQRRGDVDRRDVEGLENYQDDLKQLGPGTVMIHYVVLPDKVRIVVTTPEIQVGRAASIPEGELNRKIHQFREVLRKPYSDPRPLARELYEALIAPIAEDLRQAKAQTLMISLDGVLRYIPLAALYDGKRYLVESFRMAVLTEATRNRLTAPAVAQAQFAGLGLTRQVQGFDPLPGVRAELDAIMKSGLIQGEVHLDEAFTADRMRQALASKVSLLHVASHFVFSPGTEVDSFLLMGDGSKLSLREIREARFNFRGIDLLTLSACDTAIGGGADGNGREVEGLGALAQQRGARAVMATLWPVADASTGVLMESFYRLRVGAGGMSKAEALQRAQLGLLRGEHLAAKFVEGTRGLNTGGATARSEPDRKTPYSHPYFWAPFILMGNWL